jgi:streptomycin 6-kinase
MEGPSEIMGELRLSAPRLVARTRKATVWKVDREEGPSAALKVYHASDMGYEARAPGYMAAHSGQAMVKVWAFRHDALLMEWLNGPSLKELSETGPEGRREAPHRFLRVALDLHRPPDAGDAGLPDLTAFCTRLFDPEFAADCPESTRRSMNRARDVARLLHADPVQPAVLHGDLHYDNIRLGPRGWCAFDAMPVVGEREFDVANGLRSPGWLVTEDADYLPTCADLWSDALGLDRTRLLRWAVVRTAWAIKNKSGGRIGEDGAVKVLDRLLAEL